MFSAFRAENIGETGWGEVYAGLLNRERGGKRYAGEVSGRQARAEEGVPGARARTASAMARFGGADGRAMAEALAAIRTSGMDHGAVSYVYVDKEDGRTGERSPGSSTCATTSRRSSRSTTTGSCRSWTARTGSSA